MNPFDALTNRERQVAGLIAQGLSNAGVASELNINPRTVERHLANIYRALELPERDTVNRRVWLALLWHEVSAGGASTREGEGGAGSVAVSPDPPEGGAGVPTTGAPPAMDTCPECGAVRGHGRAVGVEACPTPPPSHRGTGDWNPGAPSLALLDDVETFWVEGASRPVTRESVERVRRLLHQYLGDQLEDR